MKKIFLLLTIFLMSFILVSCEIGEGGESNNVIISFNVNGGTPHIQSYTVERGSYITKPTEEITKAGFNFEYWTLNNEEYTFDKPVLKSMTLVAKWKEKTDKEAVLTHVYDFTLLPANTTYVKTAEEISIKNDLTNENGVLFERLNAAITSTLVPGVTLGIREKNNFNSAYLKTKTAVDNLVKVEIDYIIYGKENEQNIELVSGIYIQTSNDGNSWETVHDIKPEIINEENFDGTVIVELDGSSKYIRVFAESSGKTSNYQQRTIIETIRLYTLEDAYTGETYGVTFNYNYDDAPDNVLVNVRENSYLKNLPNAFRRGYKFLGWFESDLETKFNFNNPITSNHVLYALWEVYEEGDNPSENDPNILAYYGKLNGLDGLAFKDGLATLIKTTGKANEDTGSTQNVKSADNFEGKNYNIYDGFGTYGNREHVWPKSHLGSRKFDLHNLRAAVSNTNSLRGNRKFGDSVGGWKVLSSGDFYPGDEHIGDVARIVLYIHIFENIPLSRVGDLEMFIEWHNEDPVNDFERSRNNKIYGVQNNRNPFIDFPEYVDYYFNASKQLLNVDFNTNVVFVIVPELINIESLLGRKQTYTI